MAVIFRPVTDKDLDYVYALAEIEKIAPFLGKKRECCKSVIQHCQMAEDKETGCFIMNLPQRDRMDGSQGYLLVRSNGIVIMRGPKSGAWSDYPVVYVSPALAGQLDALTPLLREAFSKGGQYLFGDPADYEVVLASKARFVVEQIDGE